MQNRNPFAPTLQESLQRSGYALHRPETNDTEGILVELARQGELLGSRAGGRSGALEEVIRPRASIDAHPRSLSAKYGLESLPYHVELSHRPRPCRYLLLACLEPGSSQAATRLLDWRAQDFLPSELDLLQHAPVLMRSGRRSFYSTLLPSDRAFLRFDPGCTEAVDDRGRAALTLLDQRFSAASPEAHEWARGDILIIDNWRMLHGRAPSESGSGRRLVRILIDA